MTLMRWKMGGHDCADTISSCHVEFWDIFLLYRFYSKQIEASLLDFNGVWCLVDSNGMMNGPWWHFNPPLGV
jgi:hypothetical protein